MSKREDAFASFGTELRNPQWSWSARSPDGCTVAAMFWQDFFKGGRYVFPALSSADKRARPGFRELIENLTWARDQLGGQVRAVLARAKDTNADVRVRKIASCSPRHDIIMQLLDLDPETGAHVCEMRPVKGGDR
jgi:hypothetical protein